MERGKRKRKRSKAEKEATLSLSETRLIEGPRTKKNLSRENWGICALRESDRPSDRSCVRGELGEICEWF